MALADHAPSETMLGITEPRIAPPVPARSLIAEYEAAAAELGIELMPWQHLAARYMTAVSLNDRWLFRSFAAVVARQNGKTELLLPYILMELRRGRRLLHTAQNRALPRETFLRLAAAVNGNPDVVEMRFANGQEVIKWSNGGRYTLVAPRPGVRGNSVDDVILDEVREQRNFELMAGIKPTMTASRNPQIIYLSNAGDDESVVLNDLRRRMDSDPSLAYLEWSASPDRALDDREGWREANPALGITIQLETLEDFHLTFPPAVFETEHLCRWVLTMQPRLIDDLAWLKLRQPLEKPRLPWMGVSMDPSGGRASGVIAWQRTDGTIGLRVIAEVTGDPIDVDRLGEEMHQLALRMGVPAVGYDPLTDAALAKHFRNAKGIAGNEYANACARFYQVVAEGRLRWDEADAVTADLPFTARRPHEGSSGAWKAVKAKEERPITAVLAAIRAVSLATGPRAVSPKVF